MSDRPNWDSWILQKNAEARQEELRKSEFVEVTPLEKKHVGFKAVEESAREHGASDPAAVAAAVGRKKYGKKAFQEAAAAGKKMGKAEDKDKDDEDENK